jgi:hypothetical protein
MRRPRLYVLGDSISIHYHASLQRRLEDVAKVDRKGAALLAEGVQDDDEAVNGGDALRVLAHLRAVLPNLTADLVVLNCGLHDIKVDPSTGLRQVPPDVYERSLVEAVGLVRDRRVGLVWIRTTPVDERLHNDGRVPFYRFEADVERYNAIADAIMAGHGVPIVDLHAFTLTVAARVYDDHVHFVASVRDAQGAFVAGALQRVLEPAATAER